MDCPGFIGRISICQAEGRAKTLINRYCIRQYREQEKMEQIKKMHEIYSNSEVIIIAACGDSDYGLPDVSKRGRTYRHHIRVGSTELVWTFPISRTSLKTSR